MTFESNIINIYGDRGKAWLGNISEIVRNVAKRYSLSELTPVANLSYNYVASGAQNKQPIILKLSLDVDGLKREVNALNAFAEYGAPKILAEDNGLLLLERAVPGASLRSHFPTKDHDTVSIVCSAMQRLHAAPLAPNHNFVHIREWLGALDQYTTSDDQLARYLQQAIRLKNQLLAIPATEVLLHGDLHHDNILQNGHDWIAIDPKGVVGTSDYEVAAFIRNPIPELLTLVDPKSIIHDRISAFSTTLGIPQERILDWCFVQSVLSWIWAIEDGCDYGYFKRLTAVFDEMQCLK